MPAEGRQKLGQCGSCDQCYALCPKTGKLRKHHVGHGGGYCEGEGSFPVLADLEGGLHQGVGIVPPDGFASEGVEEEGKGAYRFSCCGFLGGSHSQANPKGGQVNGKFCARKCADKD